MDINTGRIIKARLAALGKTQKDLFVELNSSDESFERKSEEKVVPKGTMINETADAFRIGVTQKRSG